MTQTALGLDVGGTHIRAARVTASGEIEASLRMPSGRDPRAVLDACLDLAGQLRGPETCAIGIGVPGQVAAGKVLSGGYVDLSGLDVLAEVKAAFGLPAVIENDATMALLGEAAKGAAKGAQSAVLLTIGTGIGGAVLEGGRVLRGHGTAGQLGHISVETGGRPCLCGRTGCLETVSSGSAFAQHLSEAELPPETRAEDLLARLGDPIARRVLIAWAAPLRRAIETLIAIFNPELVLLGGGAGAAQLRALTLVQPRPSWFSAPAVGASLGEEAGVIGAALAALSAPKGRRAVLVNGVPASGKSTVARALAQATGWPILSLDRIKTPFLAELSPVDRSKNRALGRASYLAIFALLADLPPSTTAIVDAWFGFQPAEVLARGLREAQVEETVELWCAAPPETVGARYAARVGERPEGHPGNDYVPELIALAARAEPLGGRPLRRIDTTEALNLPELLAWIGGAWPGPEKPGPEKPGLEKPGPETKDEPE